MRFDGTQATASSARQFAPGQDPNGIPELVRTATDSFVELVAAHIRLTNLELVADIEARTRLAVLQLAISVAAVVGYGLVMVAAGLAAGTFMSRSAAFLILGALHLAAAGIAAIVLSHRRRRPLQLDQAMHSLEKSVTAVTDAVLGPAGQAHARS